MLVFVSMLALTALVSVLAVRLRYKDEGLFSTTFVFTLGAFVYFLSIPMERYFLAQPTAPMVGYYFEVPVEPGFYIKIFLTGIAGILAFTYGLRLSGFKSLSADRAIADEGQGVRIFETAMWILWAALIAGMALFYRDYIVNAMGSYEDSYGTQYASPLPTLMLQIIALLNAILAVFLAIRKKFWPIMGAILLFAANICMTCLFYEKSEAVLALIGMGYLYFYWIRNKRLALAGALIGIFLALFILKPAYNLVIAGVKSPAKIIELLKDSKPSFTALDSGGPMTVAASLMSSGHAAPSWGKDLLQSFVIFVPRVVWPERPLDASEDFAKRMIPDWKPGIGMGYSPVIEGYVNFGLYLASLEFLLFGFLWGWMWRGFMRCFAFYKTPMRLDIFYRIAGYYLLILFFRGLIAGTAKQTIMYMVPFGAALAGMWLLTVLWARYAPRKKALA